MKCRMFFVIGVSVVVVVVLGVLVCVMEKVKVGFIYVGLINDGGWIQYYYYLVMEMVEYFGDVVEFVY